MASATKSQWSERAASALMAARLLDRSPSSWSCSEVKLSVAAIAFLLSQTKLAACIQSTREGNRSLGLLLLSDIVNKSLILVRNDAITFRRPLVRALFPYRGAGTRELGKPVCIAPCHPLSC